MSGITLAHNFVSAKGNGTDLTLIQPSNWNDQHILKCDAYQILGNQTASNAAVQQIPLTPFMATLLAAADMPTLAGLIGLFSTGDGKLTFKTVADAGWIMLDDTSFGPVGSAAGHTSASYQALFTLMYNNISDAGATLYTTIGSPTTRATQGTASAAWTAGCILALPKQLGRAFVGAGAGVGLTSRPLGATFGSDSISLSLTQLPGGITSSGTPSISVVSTVTGVPSGMDNGAFLAYNGASYGSYAPGKSGGSGPVALGQITSTSSNSISLTSNNTGGSTTPVTQASAAWNVMVKL